jgi:signal transduction histidine kinase
MRPTWKTRLIAGGMVLLRILAALIIITIAYMGAPDLSYAESNTLEVICVNNDYPYIYQDENGLPKGVVYDLFKSYENSSGKKVTFKLCPPESVYQNFEKAGDVLFDANTAIDDSDHYLLSRPFILNELALAIKESSFRTISGDRDSIPKKLKTVGIKHDSLRANIFKKSCAEASIMSFDNNADAFSALSAGSIDAFGGPRDQIETVISENGYTGFTIIDTSNTNEPYCFMVKDSAILAALDAHIASYIKSSEFEKSYRGNFKVNRFGRYMTLNTIVAINATIAAIFFALFIFFSFKNSEKERLIFEKDSKLQKHINENQMLLNSLMSQEKTLIEFHINLSHEFRTPLNLILSASQSIESLVLNGDFKKLSNNFTTYNKMIRSNIFRLMKLINNITDLKKIEDSTFLLRKELIDIYFVTDELVTEINGYLGKKQVFIHSGDDYSTIELLSECDPQILRRMILNLVSNSLKHSQNLSKIMILIENTEKNVYLSVIDDGDGISDDKIKSIFSVYNKISASEFSSNEGAGLGIYLMNTFSKLIGGSFLMINKPSVLLDSRRTHSIISIPLLHSPYTFNNDYKDYSLDEFELINKYQVEIEFSDIYTLSQIEKNRI